MTNVPKMVGAVLALSMGIMTVFPGAASAAEKTLAERHEAARVACAGCHQETPPSKKVKTSQCQTCHGDYAALAERTKDMKPNNAHANHLGDLDCGECHKAHAEDRPVCLDCHQFEFSMPAK